MKKKKTNKRLSATTNSLEKHIHTYTEREIPFTTIRALIFFFLFLKYIYVYIFFLLIFFCSENFFFDPNRRKRAYNEKKILDFFAAGISALFFEKKIRVIEENSETKEKVILKNTSTNRKYIQSVVVSKYING